jgi:hypothetical protein
VSLTRPDVGFNIIYLRAGLPTFEPRERATRTADGLLIQVEDPNGIIVQPVQWVAAPPESVTA